MKVVLTRERGRNEELVAWLPDGAETFEVPLTETRYFEADEVRRTLVDTALKSPYRSLVVTSSRSARFVETALASCTGDVEVFSVGPSTTRALAALGQDVCAQSTGGALELSLQIRSGPVLLLGAATMREELGDDLRSRGMEVAKVACYETRPIPPDEIGRRLIAEADVVVIGAPSAWAVAREFVAPTSLVVVPGESTARSVEVDHERTLVGWGPSWRVALAAPDPGPGEPTTDEQ